MLATGCHGRLGRLSAVTEQRSSATNRWDTEPLLRL